MIVRKNGILVLSIAATLLVTNAIPAQAAWEKSNNQWFYLQEDTPTRDYIKNAWIDIDNAWYFFKADGQMAVGWQYLNDNWYFFYPDHGDQEGKLLTGWQWISGKCYYFSLERTDKYPQGAMYYSDTTPDGYTVDSSGAWTDSNGSVFIEGKGFLCAAGTVKKGNGGFGGSGGSGSSPGKPGKPDDIVTPDPELPVNPDNQVPANPDNQESEKDLEDTPASPSDADPVYTYTIRRRDIVQKTTLQVMTASGTAGMVIDVPEIDIDGYEVCKDQKERFKLDSDGMVINIYYERLFAASPSEARKVSWEVRFVEEEDHGRQIFKMQKGQSEEGAELVVDFPENIIGTDGYYYNSIVSSPYIILVSGTGIQKYYIEYQRGDPVEPEVDPDAEAKGKLEHWIMISVAADRSITGGDPSPGQLITDSLEASNKRLESLVSAVDDSDRHEIYLIARGHTPNSLVLGQDFSNLTGISQLVVDSFTIQSTYCVMRIGFQKTYDAASCVHRLEVQNIVPAGCLANGHEAVYCGKCGFEETVILPAAGHKDTDGDGICDICYEVTDGTEQPEPVHYDIGDLQVRKIGGEHYLFRCIDDDYRDGLDNNQQTALFLCDTVIRSDVVSTSDQVKKLKFGSNNNYKYADVRSWLNSAATDSLFALSDAYIGINTAYQGSTQAESFEQFEETELTGHDKPFQLMEDKIFLLSVEEAVKYRDYLWKFAGSEENNPQTRYSAYSKGYYLRTPQYTGSGTFQYGTGIYAVGLDGSIRPVPVSSQDIGVRPAMTVIQR